MKSSDSFHNIVGINKYVKQKLYKLKIKTTMSKEMRKYIDTFKEKMLKESVLNPYTMYSGISLKQWNNVWKDKNLTDRLTNVTSDKTFAFDYSYDFEIGKYDDVIVEISNIPLDAFVGYRDDEYSDDEDFETMEDLSNDKKKRIIDNYSLFLVSLYEYKDIISTRLIEL